MFNNLIESSSHRREFRRRGSFFLFTTASYALLFIIAGVVSIYAYDARMEDQSLELATIMPLVELPAEVPKVAAPDRPVTPKDGGNKQTFFERKEQMDRVDQPAATPDKISTTPNPGLPVPKGGGQVIITGRDADPSEPGDGGSKTGGNHTVRTPPVVVISEPPPAQPLRKPPVVSKGVITSEALSLPKPMYPEMAKQMRLQGKVTIQVLIDETGKVISARVLDGHPLFKQAAERAACQARFSPTRLSDQPVKVSGVISYNFVLR